MRRCPRCWLTFASSDVEPAAPPQSRHAVPVVEPSSPSPRSSLYRRETLHEARRHRSTYHRRDGSDRRRARVALDIIDGSLRADALAKFLPGMLPVAVMVCVRYLAFVVAL